MTDVAEFLTIQGLDEALQEVGLSIHDVRAGGPHDSDSPGLYFDATISQRGLENRLVLVVTTYARNEHGKRYIGFESPREAATETRRFFIGNLGSLVPCTEVSRGEAPLPEEI